MTIPRYIFKIFTFSLLCVAYFWLYGSTWLDMQRVWNSSATYNHCYLIIPISLYFLFRSKQHPPCKPVSQQWIWLAVLVIAISQLVWLFSFAADIALLMHLAAVVTLQMLIWLLLGNDNSRNHLFAIGYLLFLVPFGDEFSPMLQNITADLTVIMLNWANIPVYREGLFLATPVGLFEVAEACSGLRFLISSLAISALFSYLHFNKLYKQIGFVLFMAVLSILANGVRAFMLVYIGETTNMRYGFGADHYVYGWVFFGLVLIAGFWLGARFADIHIPLCKNIQRSLLLKSNLSVLISTAAVIVTILSFRLSLDIVHPPVIAKELKISQLGNSVVVSNWGISFENSMAQSYFEDENGIEYFVAFYHNKQQLGELISWNNNLFDKSTWQVQQQISVDNTTVLQLNSLKNEQRTVMYWYQVGMHKTDSLFKTKLLQVFYFLKDERSGAYIFAVSTNGPANEYIIDKLKLAATSLSDSSSSAIPFANLQPKINKHLRKNEL
ncbi:exosortase A [Alishewanella tabrizica]|uniref:Exosortase A n=1 Tax=Alishewanella tabrizica TaxID=671278 RepID=A0ABQ2WNE6_9ALTE|nr:exosortase A [Alishewanella tabrizica]GGW62604.1 exosortase A [Alishewanella tabrizica]